MQNYGIFIKVIVLQESRSKEAKRARKAIGKAKAGRTIVMTKHNRTSIRIIATFELLLPQKLRRTLGRQLKVAVTIYNFVATFIRRGRSSRMLRQPDNNVEDINSKDIVAKNSILSQQIFYRSIVKNQEKIVLTNSEDKSVEEMSQQI